jgi:hypothetical protein
MWPRQLHAFGARKTTHLRKKEEQLCTVMQFDLKKHI